MDSSYKEITLAEIKQRIQSGLKRYEDVLQYSEQSKDLLQLTYEETKIFRLAKKINNKLKKMKFYEYLKPVVNLIKKKIPRNRRCQKKLHIKDLLNLDDKEFIINAYRVILGREPDADGLQYYLSGLRRFKLSKIEIIWAIRFSIEGKSKGIVIKGLKWKYFIQKIKRLLYRIPLVGYILKLFVLLTWLPNILEKLEQNQTSAIEVSKMNKEYFSNKICQIENELSSLKVSLDGKVRIQDFTDFKNNIRQIDELNEQLIEIKNQINQINMLVEGDNNRFIEINNRFIETDNRFLFAEEKFNEIQKKFIIANNEICRIKNQHEMKVQKYGE